MNNTTSPALTPADQAIEKIRDFYLASSYRAHCNLRERLVMASEAAYGASMALDEDYKLFQFSIACSHMSVAVAGWLAS